MVAMDRDVALPRCRACGHDLHDRLIDLGPQPDPDRLLGPADDVPAPTAPIDLWLCDGCALVQLVGPRPTGPLPRHGHSAGGSADLAPWPVDLVRAEPRPDRVVVDVDVADVGIGRAFAARGLGLHGFTRQVDLDGSTDRWITAAPFDAEAADAIVAGGVRAAVVIASHALSHADDPDALVASIARILAPDGVVAIEFHHVLGLIEGQFDVISHAHRSYLSVRAVEHLLARHDLVLIEAERVTTYGGTIRAIATWSASATAPASPSVAAIRRAEDLTRAGEPVGYAALPGQVDIATAALVDFLEGARAAGRLVGGYGAPPRGTVLLNLAGVDPSLLSFTVDRDPAKQGWLLPGCRIPVHALEEIDNRHPDDILVLPWPLADEIQRQLAAARGRGSRFLVAMPSLRVL